MRTNPRQVSSKRFFTIECPTVVSAPIRRPLLGPGITHRCHYAHIKSYNHITPLLLFCQGYLSYFIFSLLLISNNIYAKDKGKSNESVNDVISMRRDTLTSRRFSLPTSFRPPIPLFPLNKRWGWAEVPADLATAPINTSWGGCVAKGVQRDFPLSGVWGCPPAIFHPLLEGLG